MVKEILKIEVEGNTICSKPLQLEDNLSKIRNIIMKRIAHPFVFLDDKKNFIDQEDEEEFLLSQIKDGDVIRLKKIESNENSFNTINIITSINVYLDDKQICSINCSENNKLNEARKLINNSFKNDFLFLDSSLNFIEKEDEEFFEISKILINGAIKIKLNSTTVIDSPPPVPIQKKNDKQIKKKKIDFSNYQIIEKKNNLTIYKYSNKKYVSQQKLVYQYFFDNYEAIDYDRAYVVLFCGKTGDGKSTAINAFFNIIKGIELEDNYRFLLITEVKKPKGQAESQTDGVHLYYLKDYNDKPIIIIDSQGYGDTIEYDQKINDAFAFVFSHVINHINTVCFISKANTNRFDICTRYIFNSVTCLFAENITENFIVVPTFATKDTINDGPAFIESIKTDADFLKIQDRMNDKWWYALDSKSVLDNDTDKITKFSFEQMKELYETKIKKLPPKEIKQSAEGP